MAKFKAVIELECEIEDWLVDEYEPYDMIQNDVGNCFNGHGFEWEVISVDTID